MSRSRTNSVSKSAPAKTATKTEEKSENQSSIKMTKAKSKKTAVKSSVSSSSGGKKLVIVESPTKAKTIRKFLGRDFIVESCMGHVRDLPQSAKDIPEKYKKEKWANIGVDFDHGFEPIYCVPKNKTKVVSLLKQKLAEAQELYLATDEDREGESISWHLQEILKPKVPVKRMVFHEITEEAISSALKDTRQIDSNLVHAQEARRILDRLVGYTLSPLLWKKIAYGLSAGRVQSVAVKLITMREHQRMLFRNAEYYGVEVELQSGDSSFSAKLLSSRGQRVATGKDFDGSTGKLNPESRTFVLNGDEAKQIAKSLEGQKLEVREKDEKPVNRKPAAPFITSTLQQEASRKLGLSARETMQVAQKLYEQGFITYMRTDSTFLSEEAIKAARKAIGTKYGSEFLPDVPRNYSAKKVKGAQEAHEAIRPAGKNFLDPEKAELEGLQFKIYDMIWKRTIASQMNDSRQKQMQYRFEWQDLVFSSSGMTIEFPGFLRAYVEGSDDPDADLAEKETRLPNLSVGQKVQANSSEATQHQTKPPARFTEASLIQTMEKEGIGRPSTYASIISTIVDRGYVQRVQSALIPTFTALVVIQLLEKYLPLYVDLHFTSEMEESLDKIADGELDSKKYLKEIYLGPKGLLKLVEKEGKNIDPDEARSIKLEHLQDYSFRVGKYGAYVCKTSDKEEKSASIPEGEAPADVDASAVELWLEAKEKGQDALGIDAQTQLPIYARTGRYGPYVQLGDVDQKNPKPKRVSLPAGTNVTNLALEEALKWLSLPKTLGVHPEKGVPVQVGLGRFGPYIVCAGEFRSIPKTDSLFEVDLPRALEIFATPKKGRGRAQALKDLGADPESGDRIQLFDGPYGLYVKSGKLNASLPKGTDPKSLSLDQALGILSEKRKAS